MQCFAADVPLAHDTCLVPFRNEGASVHGMTGNDMIPRNTTGHRQAKRCLDGMPHVGA